MYEGVSVTMSTDQLTAKHQGSPSPRHWPEPRLLTEEQARAYAPLRADVWDRLIKEGRIKKYPFGRRGKFMFDRLQIDRAIDALWAAHSNLDDEFGF